MNRTPTIPARREVLRALGISALGAIFGFGEARAQAFGRAPDETAGVALPPHQDGPTFPSFGPRDPGHVAEIGRNGSLGVLLDRTMSKGAGPAVAAAGAEALITVSCGGDFALKMEGSKAPGAQWYGLPCIRLDDGSYTVRATVRDAGSYSVDIGGWARVRANCVDISSSPLTVG